MFQYFPKIDYNLQGQTLQFTNIFKTVNVSFSNPNNIAQISKIEGERADQLSWRLYNNSNYYWTLFFANGIKNPLTEWGISEQSYTEKIEKEYDGFSYQFANNSKYLPPSDSVGFNSAELNSYTGVPISDIQVGDLIIIETGNGSYSIKCLGAGVIVGDPVYGTPQFGQSIIPDDLDNQSNTKQVSCGSYFSSCLDTDGKIYAWGEEIGLDNTPFAFNKSAKGLYSSKESGYTFIHASGQRIIAITPNSGLTCFGDCIDFNQYYGGETGFVKTYWTSGNTGGLGIKTNGTIVHYGLTGPNITFYDADCGFDYCVGIKLSDYGLTGWGGITSSSYASYFPEGITGFTAIACGISHNIGLLQNGLLYGFGISAEGRTVVPTGTYKKISAGNNHSAAINTDNELLTWGKIVIYQTTNQMVASPSVRGLYSLLNCGSEHLILTNYGDVKKYIGVVNEIDDTYKKIGVRPYLYPDVNPLLLDNPEIDPSGSIVSVWRYNQITNQYEEVKTIQNKFLTIQKYLDSVIYVQSNGILLDPSISSNWQTYLTNYQDSNNKEDYFTLRKKLLNTNQYNTKQVNYLSKNDVYNLDVAVNKILTNQTTSSITITTTS